MVRAPCFDKDGIKKGAWSEEEDNKLRLHIQRYGHRNWRELPKLAGLSRCGKSCRLRWMNYLRPNIKRGNFTKEEEDVIVDLYNKLGSKWSLMASQLKGRSDNEIKNYWHTHLKNRVLEDKIALKDKHVGSPESNKIGCPANKLSDFKFQEEVGFSCGLPSSSSTSEQSLCWLSDSGYAVSSNIVGSQLFESEESFWTEPFFLDNDNVILSMDNMFLPMFF